MIKFSQLCIGAIFSLHNHKFIKISNNLDNLSYITKETLPQYNSNCCSLVNYHYCTILPTASVTLIKSPEMFNK